MIIMVSNPRFIPCQCQ